MPCPSSRASRREEPLTRAGLPILSAGPWESRLALLTLCLLLVASLTMDAAAQERRWPRRERASESAPAGTVRETLQVGGRERSFYVHVPPSWDGRTPLPLLVLLHGGGGNALQALRHYPLEGVADRERFILVAPNGTGAFRRDVLLTWNVGFGFGKAWSEGVDDTGFIRAVIKHVARTRPVDRKRVFLTGLSNGAMLCHWAGAANSDLIAGIAPVVGTVAGRAETQPAMVYPRKPERPVSVVLFNGALDEHVPLEGGWQKRHATDRKYLASAMESARFWVEANGCGPTPRLEENATTHYRRYTWSGGRNGTAVVLYVLTDQGHAWPGGAAPRDVADKPSTTVKAHDILWDFFKAHPRP